LRPFGKRLCRSRLVREEEVKQVKKTLSREALVKEAAFWTRLMKAAKDNPGKVCHK
jgi:hypothetical protein